MNYYLRLVSIFFVVSFIPNSAFAEPPLNSSGHYLQIDAVHSSYNQEILVSKELFDSDYSTLAIDDELTNSSTSYGITYKYAFTMDDVLIDPYGRIFIAPGIFYEDISSQDRDIHFDSIISMKSRYGFKVDVGWDFDYGISTYLTNGLSVVEYEASWVNIVDWIFAVENPRRVDVSGRELGYFYGIGVSYSPVERLSFVLEYNGQKNTLNARAPGGYASSAIIFDRIASAGQIIKFGIAYHF